MTASLLMEGLDHRRGPCRGHEVAEKDDPGTVRRSRKSFGLQIGRSLDDASKGMLDALAWLQIVRPALEFVAPEGLGVRQVGLATLAGVGASKACGKLSLASDLAFGVVTKSLVLGKYPRNKGGIMLCDMGFGSGLEKLGLAARCRRPRWTRWIGVPAASQAALEAPLLPDELDRIPGHGRFA